MGFRRRFTVEGLNLERFLQAAAQNATGLTEVHRDGARKLTAVVDEAALPQLLSLADEGGWMLTQGDRIGAGRAADALRRRWLMAIGAAVMAILCLVSSRMCWRIELIDAGAYAAEIHTALEEMGIEAPCMRSSVDLKALRDALEWRYPQVAWFECGWRGVTLTVRAVQGNVKPGAEADAEPCDVVAAQDGVVQQIITRAGTPVVKPGDTVRAGQVLIEGKERTSAGEVKPVEARGSVYARVWVEAAVETPLRGIETTPTGAEQTTVTVVCPWFSLWRSGESGYAYQDVHVQEIPLGGLFLPFKIRTETRIETDLQSVTRDFQSVLEENERAAMQKLLQMTGGRDSLVDNWVNWSIIKDEILLSVATGEMLVDIAQQERSSDMAASD